MQNCVEQTTPDPDAWKCPDAWGYFPDPEACCQFYICEDDVATMEVCPTGEEVKSILIVYRAKLLTQIGQASLEF